MSYSDSSLETVESPTAHHQADESMVRISRGSQEMQGVTELEVYQAGQLSVIGFGGREILHQLNLAECYDEVMDLIREHECKTLAIDLTGVLLIPSGMLGILASVHRLGVEIHLFNPSQDICEVLEITKVNRLLSVHQIDV